MQCSFRYLWSSHPLNVSCESDGWSQWFVCIESVSSVEGGPKGIRRRRLRRSRQRSSTPTSASQTGRPPTHARAHSHAPTRTHPYIHPHSLAYVLVPNSRRLFRTIGCSRHKVLRFLGSLFSLARSCTVGCTCAHLYIRKHSELIYAFV